MKRRFFLHAVKGFPALMLLATSLLAASCTASLDSSAVPGQTPSLLGYVTLDVDAQPISLQDDVREPAGFAVRVLPEYPREAFDAGIGGFVRVHVFVDASGWPRELEIVKSVPALDAAVVTAVQRSSYRPARDSNGEPVESWVALIARFEPR